MTTKIKRGADIETIKKALSKIKTKKRLDASKYSGSITSIIDPLQIQKELRDEWK
ncbi:hypothetical protein [Aquiflexum sp.]|uniref:hypothetical protein n=1 Tax=Aquiflexum sp. TaxID=1872584 RepID=UPI003593CFCF